MHSYSTAYGRRTFTIANTRKERILLVEDDQEVAALVDAWLKRENFEVVYVDSAEAALELLQSEKFDAIIMDWILPSQNGIDACKVYRQQGGTTPTLMLTTLTHADDVEASLDAGCDDYLRKPFELRELSARLRALLRRPQEFNTFELKAREITLETKGHKVFKNGEEVSLLPKEFALLRFLMLNKGIVFSPEELLDNVWASDAMTSPASIRLYVMRLRKKIDVVGKPSLISNIHGVGYRFENVA